MLDYLITSKTRRLLLTALWMEGQCGTAQSLAQKTGVAFAGAYKELQAMEGAGLAESNWSEGKKVYRANAGHPMADVLTELLQIHVPLERPDEAISSRLRENLAFLGLPVNARKVSPPKGTKLESLLANAFDLSAEDASVARALPVLLKKLEERIDYRTLKYECRKLGNKHRAGFFLELTGRLDDDLKLMEASRSFLDHRYKGQKAFFNKQSETSSELAKQRSPALARKWGWLMNMDIDAFESTYRKFHNG